MIEAPQQAPAFNPPSPERRSRPPQRVRPFRWFLAGIAMVVFCGLCLAGVGGYFAYRAARNAGVDLDLLRRKPGFAMTKLAAARNPNLEIVSTDENSDTVTARDRNTNAVATYRYDLDKKSLVVVPGEGTPARIAASGEGVNSFEVKGPDGSMKFGPAAAESAPDWIPVYGGATLQGGTTTTLSEGEQNWFTFETKDAPAKVLAFYRSALKNSGFTVDMAMTGAQGGMLQGQADGGKRTVVISLHPSPEGTEGSIVTVETK